jgi:hypothetical protein
MYRPENNHPEGGSIMAKEVTDKQVIALLRKSPDESIAFYAKELGVPTGSIGPTIWRLEPEADPKLKFKGNKTDIVKARKDGVRWERIAARTGMSVADAKRTGGKDADIYTGRGRDFSGTERKAPAKAAGGGKRGRPAGSGRGTSGRRQSAGGGGKATRGRPRGARTRAEAQAGKSSPS